MLREKLRDATKPLHDRLDLGLGAVVNDVDKTSYIDLLCRFLGFLIPWEDRVRRVFEGGPLAATFAARSKIGWLIADLESLGFDDAARSQIPIAEDLPNVSTLGRALGSMYVIEGSTLGGVHVARRLEEKLGLNANNGLRYFNNYGAGRNSKWREFIEILEAHSSPSVDAEAVAAAIDTFKYLGDWLVPATQDLTL